MIQETGKKKIKYQLVLDAPEKPFTTLYLHRRVTISADKKYIAMCGRQEGEPAFLWKLPALKSDEIGKPVPNTRPKLLGNNFLEFIGNTHLLMGDGARIWDVDKKKEHLTECDFRETKEYSFVHYYFDHCMDLSLDGQYLLGASLYDTDYSYHALGVWDTFTGKLLKRVDTPRVKNNNTRVSFVGGSKRFYYAAQCQPNDNFLSLTCWEIVENPGHQISTEKKKEVEIVMGRTDFTFDFSPDGKLLTIGDQYYDLEGETPVLLKVNQELTAPSLTNRFILNKRQTLVSARSGEISMEDLERGTAKRLPGTMKKEAQLVTYSSGRKVGLKNEIRKMLPKVAAVSRDNNYLIAGNNEILFVWVDED